MSTNIQETIDRLRELDQKASPAPWGVGSSGESYNAIVCEDGEYISGVLDACYMGEHLSNDDPDLEVIIETRNALPALLSEIERLSTNLSIANARLGRVASNHPDAYLDSL